MIDFDALFNVPRQHYVSVVVFSFLIFGVFLFRQRLNDVICKYIEAKNTVVIKKCKSNTIYLGPLKIDNYPIGIIAYFFYAIGIHFTYFVNYFCLLVSIGQIYYNQEYRHLAISLFWSIYDGYLYIYKMSPLLKSQIEINNTLCTKVLPGNNYAKIKQSQLLVGDSILLAENDIIPADAIITYSDGQVLSNEVEIDGELVHKVKEPIGVMPSNDSGKAALRFNMLYAGAKITFGNCAATVCAIGKDCEIYKPKFDKVRNLTPVESMVERICVFNLLPLMIFSGLIALIIHYNDPWSAVSLTSLVVKGVLFLNTIIPLSSKIYFNHAINTFSKKLSAMHKVKISNKGRIGIQSIPNCIVSDKTGTLTLNKTQFIDRIFFNYDEKKECRCVGYGYLACNQSPISATREIINVDPIDYALLTIDPNVRLKTNFHGVTPTIPMGLTPLEPSDSGKAALRFGEFSFIDYGTIVNMKRLYFKNFDYETELKCTVAMCNYCRRYILYAQGTCEAIQKYSIVGKSISRSEYQFTDAYARIIGHGSTYITEDDLLQLTRSPLDNRTKILTTKILNKGLSTIGVYIFEDLLIPNVGKSVQSCIDMGINFCICTGDGLDSSIDVVKALNLDTLVDQRVVLDSLNISSLHTSMNGPLFIDGRMMNLYTSPSHVDNFIKCIKSHKIKCVYRASPMVKQAFVSFMKKYLGFRVAMIGDGANDLGALVESDLAIACRGESSKPKSVCDVEVENWNVLPAMLRDFRYQSSLVENLCKWNLMQHMLKAYSNLAFFALDGFTHLPNLDNFVAMLVFKISIFILANNYCRDEDLHYRDVKFPSFATLLIKGCLMGLISAIVTWFILEDVNANVLLSVNFCQLFLELVKFRRASFNRYELILCGGWLIWFFINGANIILFTIHCILSWLIFYS